LKRKNEGIIDVEENGSDVKIEFEFKSSNFIRHGHNPDECDVIVCWQNDWKNCPIEIIELKEEIKKLPKTINYK
jgi:hypothetical protein